MVHQVPESDKGSGNGNGDDKPVNEPEEIQLAGVGEVNKPQNHGDSPAMACQSLVADEMPLFIYGQQHLQRVRHQKFGLVKQKMPQAESDNTPHNGPDGESVQRFLRNLFLFENLL